MMQQPIITMSPTEQANRFSVEMSKRDQELNDILLRIETDTQALTDNAMSFNQKYQIAVSVEYLMVRARIIIESEHIRVKQVTSDPNVSQSLKNIFIKRNVYLAEVSAKLTNIQNDLSVLQKIVYTNSNFIKK